MIYRRPLRVPSWSIPALYAAIAVVAAFTLPRIERALFPHFSSGLSTTAAVAIFSAVGSGMIALTGIVFSLTFLMVQFSATAYSPRLVMWLAREPVIWHAVGIFSATFLYSIAAIAQVDRGGTGETPFFSSWLVIVLLLASVAMFIAMIEKISVLQIHRMLSFTADYGRQVVEQMYEPLESSPSPPEKLDDEEYLKLVLTQTLTYKGRPQALQVLDITALLAMSMAHDATLVVVSSVGDTLVEGTVMLRVYGGRQPIDEAELRRAFVMGDERTFEQDPKYAIRLLVDIAIKALSPAVNDPTTAVQALDQIEDLLRRLGQRRLETGIYRDPGGRLRLVAPNPSWDDFLALAFDEIRHCGASSVQVMRRMKALAADLVETMPQERQRPLLQHQKRLDKTIAHSFETADDKKSASVEDRQGLGTPRPPHD